MELEDFLEPCKSAWEIMQEKEKEYGNSWEHCQIIFLEKRLQEEIREILAENELQKRIKECKDAINLLIMLIKRYSWCSTGVTYEHIQKYEMKQSYHKALLNNRWG